MKAICEGRDVMYDEFPKVVMDIIFVKTQRRRKEPARNTRHATEVFALLQRSN